jgi:hypothetical protein
MITLEGDILIVFYNPRLWPMHVKAGLIKRVGFWYEGSYKRGATLIIPYVLSDRWNIFHIKSMLES